MRVYMNSSRKLAVAAAALAFPLALSACGQKASDEAAVAALDE